MAGFGSFSDPITRGAASDKSVAANADDIRTPSALDNPVPSLNSISPSNAALGGPKFSLTVNGAGFNESSVVRVSGANRETTLINSTQLQAQINEQDLASPGTFFVTVFAPAPGGGSSNALPFAVTNPVIDIFSTLPTSAQTGGPAFTLTVNGANFPMDSVVRWNGNDRVTTRISSSQLLANITTADIQSPGTATITIVAQGSLSPPKGFAIACPCGYEGDVSPRPFGNNIPSISDWVQVGRFVALFETPADGCEFQRADSAPAATLGDGRLTIADWVLAGRYAAGLSPLVCADGPPAPLGPDASRPGTNGTGSRF
jgi:hypothetical protein